MTREHIKDIFKVIMLAYDRFDVSSDKIDLWLELLDGIEYENAMSAVKELIKTSKYPPSVADIRDVAYIPPVAKLTDNELMMDELMQRMIANGRL